MLALGVDGCTGGWIGVRRLNDVGQLQTLRRDTLREFLVLTPAPVIVAVDVPIGLLAAGARLCDKEARRLLGLRRASVFPAPVRPMLGSRSHSEASAIRNSIEGKGMSIQAFGILEKITEVDELLTTQPRSREIVREVHPEVSFYFLNG
jgi:predicted RNase H-like nuclease